MKKIAVALVGLVVLVAMMAGIIQLNATPAYAYDCNSICYSICEAYRGIDLGGDCCLCLGAECDSSPYCW